MAPLVLGVGLPPLPTVTCVPRPQFLAFTCGLLRGTLSTLGIKSLVTASVAALPACELVWGAPVRVRQGSPCSGGAEEVGPGHPSPISQMGSLGPREFKSHAQATQLVQHIHAPAPGCPPQPASPGACQPGGDNP